jgi:hypothetical protein
MHHLVGDPSIVTVLVDGQSCECLLDTGSQVTCIGESFFRSHLPNRRLFPLSDLIVTGAGGENVPYLGYTEVEISLPKSQVGIAQSATTLVLVCPDKGRQTPLLLGTNTKLVSELAQGWKSKSHTYRKKLRNVNSAWIRVYKKANARFSSGGCMGDIKLLSSTVIPQGASVVLECGIRNHLDPGTTILVEVPESRHFPRGLNMTPFVTKLSNSGFTRVKIPV